MIPERCHCGESSARCVRQHSRELIELSGGAIRDEVAREDDDIRCEPASLLERLDQVLRVDPWSDVQVADLEHRTAFE